MQKILQKNTIRAFTPPKTKLDESSKYIFDRSKYQRSVNTGQLKYIKTVKKKTSDVLRNLFKL